MLYDIIAPWLMGDRPSEQI